MDGDRWIRLQQLFAELREAAPDERIRWLSQVAREDDALAANLRSLLDADSTSGPMDSLAEHLTPVSTWLAGTARVPDRIGAYRVIRELGRGGMGEVYLAERADGHLEQRVAIKLIDESRDDDPQHRRFLAERQILADLVHPNIARLLDGGVVDDGRPYLVMEYVDGQPITDWCDQRRLSLRSRLALFCDVCAAVQHAHQKLVIHRDIKPSNILVAGDGRVHLLDFGIAELIAPADRLPDASQEEPGAMTPEYASPEQVRGDPLTTATDVYSLGVLLYVLVTGRRPYVLTRGLLADMADVICNHVPEAPSLRAARGDVDATSRGTSAGQLARAMHGDMDGIVAMALQKNPGDRYASADALREDIERHLARHPVVAHRGGLRYRALKFAHRHRIAVTATGLMFSGLVVMLSAAVVQGRRANRERIRAEQALAQSEGIAGFMLELFRSGGADDTASAEGLTAIDILRRGAARANALSDQPLVQARLLDVVGQMSLHLGQLDDAQRHLEQAVSIRRQAGAVARPELPASLIHLAWVYRARNEREQARTLVAEALGIREATLGTRHPDVAEALYELVGLLAEQSRSDCIVRRCLSFPTAVRWRRSASSSSRPWRRTCAARAASRKPSSPVARRYAQQKPRLGRNIMQQAMPWCTSAITCVISSRITWPRNKCTDADSIRSSDTLANRASGSCTDFTAWVRCSPVKETLLPSSCSAAPSRFAARRPDPNIPRWRRGCNCWPWSWRARIACWRPSPSSAKHWRIRSGPSAHDIPPS